MPKVSIIIPVYKTEAFIEKCARSLFEQTFKDIEYIFVNDATPDNSIDILEKVISEYPERKNNCFVVNHAKNKGLAAARNSGLAAATGEYVIHCDSDDWIHPSMIADMYHAAIEYQADIVSCDFQMVYADKTVYYQTTDWNEEKNLALNKYIASGWTVLVTLLVRRAIYVQNKLSSMEGYSYCEDFNLSVKLLYHANKIVRVPHAYYYYWQNEKSIVHNMTEKTMHDEQIMYLDVINYFKKNNVYEIFQEPLCWRILKSKQEWILNTQTYDKFLSLHPESHQYIWSCPYLNFKLKLMMWGVTHHFSLLSRFMLLLRHLRHGKSI